MYEIFTKTFINTLLLHRTNHVLKILKKNVMRARRNKFWLQMFSNKTPYEANYFALPIPFL